VLLYSIGSCCVPIPGNPATAKAPLSVPPSTRAVLVLAPKIPQSSNGLKNCARIIAASGGPKIEVVDPLPFTLAANGSRVDDPNPLYIAPYKNPVNLPPGITPDIVLNPNQLLLNDIKGQNIIETTVLRVDANPLANLNGPLPAFSPPAPLGGITNIPFVNTNAKATTMSAIFWIEKVEDSTGNVFMQLQYTQTVILDFIGIKWPHISVATLVKQ